MHHRSGQFNSSVPSLIAKLIEEGSENASFLVTNLGPVVDQYQMWMQELPMVKPFYAVKCMPDPVTLRLLGLMGCGFDCATQGEIALVLEKLRMEEYVRNNGGQFQASSCVIYSNPAKMGSHAEYAINQGVVMTVFDGEDELLKLSKLPNAGEKLELLLRIETDDKDSVCRFSNKFGCRVDDAPHMLRVAHSLGLRVAGVSFHVGSGCGDGGAYITALQHARRIFDAADAMGLPAMDMIDIGGGFPGDSGGYGGPGMPTFQDLAAAIRKGISVFAEGFSRPMSSVRIIAEPGRYFVSASTTVATKVYARKGGQHKYQALYVDDGVYGSFNNVVYDHAAPVPLKLSSVLKAEDAARAAAAFDTECSLDNRKEVSVPAAAVMLTTASIQADVVAVPQNQSGLMSQGCELLRATRLQNSDGVGVADDIPSESEVSTKCGAAIPNQAGEDSTLAGSVTLLSPSEVIGDIHTEARVEADDEELIPTAVFGPTCDGLDQMCAMESTHLPRCEIGDWIIWENMGAYTHTASFNFNGYTHVPCRRYCLL